MKVPRQIFLILCFMVAITPIFRMPLEFPLVSQINLTDASGAQCGFNPLPGQKYFSFLLSAVVLSCLPDETWVVETGSLIRRIRCFAKGVEKGSCTSLIRGCPLSYVSKMFGFLDLLPFLLDRQVCDWGWSTVINPSLLYLLLGIPSPPFVATYIMDAS